MLQLQWAPFESHCIIPYFSTRYVLIYFKIRNYFLPSFFDKVLLFSKAILQSNIAEPYSSQQTFDNVEKVVIQAEYF